MNVDNYRNAIVQKKRLKKPGVFSMEGHFETIQYTFHQLNVCGYGVEYSNEKSPNFPTS